VATKPAVRPASAKRPPPPPAPVGDIRSGRPWLLSPSLLRSFLRRLASVSSLVFLDLCGLTLGLYAALVIRELYHGADSIFWGVLWRAETDWLPFLGLVTVLVFWRAGLYGERGHRAGVGRIVGSLTLVAVLALAFGIGTDHQFHTYGLVPTAFVLTVVLVGLLRASYEVLSGEAMRIAGVRRRAILVGEGPSLAHLHQAVGSNRSGITYDFLGVVTDGPGDGELPVLGTLASLPTVLAAAQAVDELILTDSDFGDRQLLDLVEQAHRRGVQVRVAPKTTALLTERGEYIPGQGTPLFELRPPAFAGSDWVLKRTFDVVTSVLVVLLGLPLWLAVAAAIKLGSRGPVLYCDRRIGLNEQPFMMFKFRTMYADAAERQGQLESANEAEGALFKIRDDPRVTPVGRLLRRLSLDEIPQVLNVLRGEMSLVGPRPLPVRDYERLEAWHRKRYLVLPGMTGLWQIAGRADLSFDDLVRLDFYYLENWSIWLDISILAKTVPAVVAARGAY
jgi:exopolysaccharide biosynthesis polyprenyl glycosylphosphotransferase